MSRIAENGGVARCLLVGAIAFGLAATVSRAGGPLRTRGGIPITWDPAAPVNFILDNGPLRLGMNAVSRDEAAAFVRDLLPRWTEVDTSALTLEDRGFLAEDVDVVNFLDFVETRPEGNPIIFDVGGAIIDLVAGEGASEDVLGFAAAFERTGDHFYDYGLLVINGREAELSETGATGKTVLHEFGHLLGLDHTQVGIEFFFDANEELARRTVPLMFPFSVEGPAELLRDDQVWISYLYPAASFRRDLGRIAGQVRRRRGNPLPGAHVLAVPLDRDAENNPALRMEDRVGVVSGFLEIPDDSSFELPGLTPGEYAVAIEPIFPFFVGGSGVGPYDERFDEFPRDFFNAAESGDPDLDDPEDFSILQTEPGGLLEEIDLVSNEVFNRLDLLGDDDTGTFIFPDGFTFSFFGEVYQEVNVNSNGSLTFTGGDRSFSLSEMQFLRGLPRIAPLFTDLDPTDGGEITSSFDGNSLTFSWVEVPEFAAPNEDTNTFSVSLFRNGDILYRYDEVALTSGLGSPPIGLVGVSPGGLDTSPGPADLDADQPFRLGQDAIFQIFDVDEFDLVGTEVAFQLSRTLLFPLNLADASMFTGFAVSNDASDPVALQVEALQPDGASHEYPDNPHQEDLGAGRQLARLGSEFFGLPAGAVQDGWVRIVTDGVALSSFYQFGSVEGGRVTQLDGSVAFDAQSSILYFTRLHHGSAGFPAAGGPRNAETLLAVANPNSVEITVTFQLADETGGAVVAPVVRRVPPGGCLLESVSSIFEVETVSEGFVKATVAEAGAVGFELVRLDDTLLGFNASFGNPRMRLFSAQLAHGGGENPIFTSVKVINTSDEARTLVLTALAESGAELAESVTLELTPNQSLQSDAGELFGLGPLNGPARVGSLRVEADGGGVIGDVVFGDPNRLRFAAALPLQNRLLERGIFSQVANVSSPNPAMRTFTGLAFHNPNDESAEISIRVFAEGGAQTGFTSLTLPPGRRLSRNLAELIPATAGQQRGYIVVESSVPIVAQQLFGNFTLDFLSAVPPTISR